MSSLLKHHNKIVCYRCRNAFEKGNDLLPCTKCSSFWHLKCLPASSESKLTNEWICPQHQETVRLKGHKKIPTVIAREEMIEEFEVAEQIIKYGGVIHELSSETMEKDFINYSRRYREFKYPQHNSDKIGIEAPNNEHGSIPICFEHQDGIQMLLDAANTKEPLS